MPSSFKETPFWWEDAPLATLPVVPVKPECDVVIIGAGYTGLSAAITLARAGRSVQVFDRQMPGEGASSRNGGICSGNLRPSHDELVKRFGEERAKALQVEGKLAREDLAQFIAHDKVECDYKMCGRFTGASEAANYEKLAREADLLRQNTGIEAYAIPKSEQRNQLGTDYYYGGLLRNDIGGLQPAKLHAEMLRVARAAGAVVHGETPVVSVTRDGRGVDVETKRGRVRTKDVIMGTNGYTDGVDPWLRKRMVPVMSRMIATAPIGDNLMKQLMPRQVMAGDTRQLHYYFRPSHDGKRILWGGRDGALKPNPPLASARLKRAMVEVFPELSDVEISHSWYGFVAMNRDMVPRIFSHEGTRYAAGYCGSGVVWARWAGQKAALQVLGRQEGRSPLDFRPPKAIPMYNGTPWFMPAMFAWLQMQDAMARRRKASA